MSRAELHPANKWGGGRDDGASLGLTSARGLPVTRAASDGSLDNLGVGHTETAAPWGALAGVPAASGAPGNQATAPASSPFLMASDASPQGPMELNTRSFSASQLHAYWLPSSLTRVPEGFPSDGLGMQYLSSTLQGTQNMSSWPMRSHQPSVQDTKDDKQRGSAGTDLEGPPTEAAWESRGSQGTLGKHTPAGNNQPGGFLVQQASPEGCCAECEDQPGSQRPVQDTGGAPGAAPVVSRPLGGTGNCTGNGAGQASHDGWARQGTEVLGSHHPHHEQQSHQHQHEHMVQQQQSQMQMQPPQSPFQSGPPRSSHHHQQQQQQQKQQPLVRMQQEQQRRQQQQQPQQPQLAAVAKGGGSEGNRRRLARGPRSDGSVDLEPMYTEDHRVLKVDRSEDGREAYVWVTLLAAGFVIGSSGAAARQIGHVTGAGLQSWTEAASGIQGVEGEEVRRFRIQGKREKVDRVIALIYSAVDKYKELCERKREGQFVLREHRIDGVDFQYQPPPRKALQTRGQGPGSPASPHVGGSQGPGTAGSTGGSPHPRRGSSPRGPQSSQLHQQGAGGGLVGAGGGKEQKRRSPRPQDAPAVLPGGAQGPRGAWLEPPGQGKAGGVEGQRGGETGGSQALHDHPQGDSGAGQHVQLPGAGGHAGQHEDWGPKGFEEEASKGVHRGTALGSVPGAQGQGGWAGNQQHRQQHQELEVVPFAVVAARDGQPASLELPASALGPRHPSLQHYQLLQQQLNHQQQLKLPAQNQQYVTLDGQHAATASGTQIGACAVYLGQQSPQESDPRSPSGSSGVPVTYQRALEGQPGSGGQRQASPAATGGSSGRILVPTVNNGRLVYAAVQPGGTEGAGAQGELVVYSPESTLLRLQQQHLQMRQQQEAIQEQRMQQDVQQLLEQQQQQQQQQQSQQHPSQQQQQHSEHPAPSSVTADDSRGGQEAGTQLKGRTSPYPGAVLGPNGLTIEQHLQQQQHQQRQQQQHHLHQPPQHAYQHQQHQPHPAQQQQQWSWPLGAKVGPSAPGQVGAEWAGERWLDFELSSVGSTVLSGGGSSSRGGGSSGNSSPGGSASGGVVSSMFHPQGPNGGTVMGGGNGCGGGRGGGGNIWWQQHQAHLHLHAKQGTPFVHFRQSPDPSSGSPSPRLMYPPFGPAPGGPQSAGGAPQMLSLALSDFPSLPSRTTGPGPPPIYQQGSHRAQHQSQQKHHQQQQQQQQQPQQQQQQVWQLQEKQLQQQQQQQQQQLATLSGNQMEGRASLGSTAGGTPLGGPAPAVSVPAPQGAWSQGPGFRWGAEGVSSGQPKQPEHPLPSNPQQQYQKQHQQQQHYHQQQYQHQHQQQLQNQPLPQHSSPQPVANAQPPSPEPGATPGSGPPPNGGMGLTAEAGGTGGSSSGGGGAPSPVAGGTPSGVPGAPGQASGPFGFTSFFSPMPGDKDGQPAPTSLKSEASGVTPGGHGAPSGDAAASLSHQISQLQLRQQQHVQQQQLFQKMQSAGQAPQQQGQLALPKQGQVPLLGGQSAGGALDPSPLPSHGWGGKPGGALKDSQLCVCCAARPVLFRNYPCEHEAVCHVCSKTVANCPICGVARSSTPSASSTIPGPRITTIAGAGPPGAATGVGSGTAVGDS